MKTKLWLLLALVLTVSWAAVLLPAHAQSTDVVTKTYNNFVVSWNPDLIWCALKSSHSNYPLPGSTENWRCAWWPSGVGTPYAVDFIRNYPGFNQTTGTNIIDYEIEPAAGGAHTNARYTCTYATSSSPGSCVFSSLSSHIDY